MSKKALGRGLGALFTEPAEKTAESTTTDVRMLPIASISVSTVQPRTEFSEEGLRELADSIAQKGILQPLIVNDDGQGQYSIIAGERRFRAAKLAGLTEVPVVVKSLSRIDRFEVALIENIQREDLTPLEEAHAYATLIKESGLTQEDVARLVGKNRSTVTNSLRLLKMPEDMQNALKTGDLTAGHARAILSLPNPADQKLLFKRIMEESVSVRKAEDMARRYGEGKRVETGNDLKRTTENRRREPELAEFEQKLLTKFGTKAEIVGSLKSGKIVLHYFSPEDLERILEDMI